MEEILEKPWNVPRFNHYGNYNLSYLHEVYKTIRTYGSRFIKIKSYNLIFYTQNVSEYCMLVFNCDKLTPPKMEYGDVSFDDTFITQFIKQKLESLGFSSDALKEIGLIQGMPGFYELLCRIPVAGIFVKEYDPYYRWAINSKL